MVLVAPGIFEMHRYMYIDGIYIYVSTWACTFEQLSIDQVGLNLKDLYTK